MEGLGIGLEALAEPHVCVGVFIWWGAGGDCQGLQPLPRPQPQSPQVPPGSPRFRQRQQEKRARRERHALYHLRLREGVSWLGLARLPLACQVKGEAG